MKTKLSILAAFLLLSKLLLGQVQVSPQLVAQPSDPVNPVLESTLLLPFSDLDKTKIQTGLLLDAGIEFADLKKYNGTPTDSSFTTSKIINDIYGSLVMSKISSNGSALKSPADFQSEWFQDQTIDLLPIGGTYFKYNQFSESNQLAFQNMAPNLPTDRLNNISTGSLTLTPQNKILDVYVNNVWQDPYEINKVFAMAPIANSHNKLHFNVVFPPTLFLSNYTSEISILEVKFSDATNFQTVTLGQMIPVSYPSAGEYTWTYKLTLTNGQILYSKNKFSVTGDLEKYVDINDNGQAFSAAANLSTNNYWKVQLENYQYFIPFPPTVVNKPKLTLYIKLRNGQTQITKPFIVAEGFDTGHITAPRQEGGDNNIDDFLNRGGMQNTALKSYLEGNYDIIYVDWGIGTDYIQNNAELLKKAIRWVNQNKIGSEKNVVLGQSMGGLIARYALKDMEDNGENHDTKLFISHDSPHLGANTPLGLQYMLRHISKTFLRSPIVAGLNYVFSPIFTGGAPVSDILTIADTPASRQMLINYINSNYSIDNSVHNTWQATLKSKGYPQQTRNVAISNGSECGTDQNLQDLVTMHHNSKGWFVDFIGALIGGVTLDPAQVILSVVPGKSRYYYDFVARPMSSINESKQLYYGKIVYKKDILWVIPAQHTLLSGSRNQPSNVLPIDKYGGGKYRFPTSSLPEFLGNHITATDFSFVPTPSALDYNFGNTTLTENEYQKTFSPVDDASNIPFANFVAEEIGSYYGENTSHTYFSPRNRQFILNQFSEATKDQKLTTAFLCGSKVKIGGDALLCGNNNTTYTTGFAPTIQWSVINGANLVDIIGPSNQPQISLTPKANANGLLKLQAYLAGGGASNTVTKEVWIGKPMFSVSQINDPTYYNESHFYLSNSNATPVGSEQGITQVTWTKLSSSPQYGVFLHTYNNQLEGFARGSNNNWSMEVKVEATNGCGTSTQTVTITPPPAAPCETFSIAKNGETSDSYVVLKYIEPPCVSGKTVISKQEEQYQITVANSMGAVVISKAGNSFDLQGFPTGMYVVNISKDNETLVNQTIIKN
ncbi:Por secretion system C-terminal sorting domain [Chryseobacterium gleum]|uniref:Por secretion system C-terminal sorting domain n=2 Tax=Chryseobacterium gleum TaxID=250 RepID=A0A3S4LZN1_CHRGE|nr:MULTISPECIES: T9SS type A sorting domain-containing protein [Chryseobacterium]ASE61676.1 T9SS C-terminal target domain-containing protein [Chryseobacterium indologenes]EFK33858.1 hypothetical protein HMPREF0204_12927 [Chryseobacterium gleum ATCC 35910]MDG4650880.1 T9SS type A sorting domain-containing protein [Chryseobacterium arthrosphaerae]QQY34594.1 T9SS type A sorting domain-containing protein [Chryseobacterium gleum]VEE06221.1 Por secretion system C-terminal sorting domain [Chryseobact